MEVELAIRVDVFLSLFLGIGRSCRWEFINLQPQKGFMDPYECRIWVGVLLIWALGVSQAAENQLLRFQMIDQVSQQGVLDGS